MHIYPKGTNQALMTLIKNILIVLAIIVAIDAFGFFLWAVSGQVPADRAFVGTLTASVLNAF